MAAVALLALLSAAAGPITDFLKGASAQLYDRDGYISAVLPEGDAPNVAGAEEEAN
jgi:multicomponent K+:H+ antiporter subunit D